MSPDQFVARFGHLADEAAARTHVSRWVILAQWAIETGWGGSALAVRWHNLAGIRWYGRTSQTTHLGGTPGKVGTGFAGYASPDAFLSDYVHVLNLPYYDRVRTAHTVSDQMAALGRSPWDAGHYTTSGVVGGSLVRVYAAMPHATAARPPIVHPGHKYTVRAGDSLWRIAAHFYGHGGLWPRIARANRILAPYVIHPGQVITIP